MKNRIRLFLQALILMCLLFPCAARATKGTDGSVRVLLTAAAVTDRADLVLDGSYTCAGMAFQQGARVTVALTNGRIMLYYEGMTRDLGTEAAFIRHRLPDGQPNGIRINGAYALYCGDLYFHISGGQLLCVAHMETEEYLLGVLPYEMNSAFPLEALKAQAVAARTYALSHTAPDREWDVVDNTDDQVFGGITTESETVRRAVRETEGICVTYQGELVPCYYTASNGGYVESIEKVWGTSGPHGYVPRRADPYDLENPESPCMALKIPKDWTNEKDSGALSVFMKEKLAPTMRAGGFSEAPEDIRIRAVTNVTLSEPTDSESHVYTKVTFSLLLSGKKMLSPTDGEEEAAWTGLPLGTAVPAPSAAPAAAPAPNGVVSETWTELPAAVSLTLSYFGEVELPFYLSLNGANNEVTRVVEKEDAFVLEARRFGHGVGMSQRGAQRMAASAGWGYRQILRFYYRGVAFKKVAPAYRTAAALDTAFLSTPAPPATPTPRPTLMPATPKEGEYLAVVDQISTDSTLNLRKEPNTVCEVLTRLYYGQQLAVISAEGDWLHVRTDSIEGYVMARYVSRVQEDEPDGGSENGNAVH